MLSVTSDGAAPSCSAENDAHSDASRVGGKTGRPAKRHTADAAVDLFRRKRRRRSTLSWKWNRWALKGVSQLRHFVDWVHNHEYNADLLLQQDSCPALDNPLHRVAPPLMQRDACVHVVLQAAPLPSVEAIVKGADLARDGATDVSSYESDGPLLFVNFQVAKFLVETRKSVRVEFSSIAGAVPDLSINPAVARGLNDSRFQQLCAQLTTQLMHICHEVSRHTTTVFVRVGLDVGKDERSLIVCSTGASPEEAKETVKQIWKRALRLELMTHGDD